MQVDFAPKHPTTCRQLVRITLHRYQFSLAYFARMFSQCISESSKSDDVPTRLQLLSDYTTSFVYKSVSRQAPQAEVTISIQAMS